MKIKLFDQGRKIAEKKGEFKDLKKFFEDMEVKFD